MALRLHVSRYNGQGLVIIHILLEFLFLVACLIISLRLLVLLQPNEIVA